MDLEDYEEYNDNNYDIDDDNKNYEELDLEKRNSYSILKEDEALKIRENFIETATNRLDLPRDDLIMALMLFKWEVDVMAERWYDNTEKYSIESGISQSKVSQEVLGKKKVFPGNTECLVCYVGQNELENPKSDFYALKCEHYLCRDCWYEYLIERLKEVNTAIQTPCPQGGCNCIVSESIFIDTLSKDPINTKFYYKSVLKNFTDFNKVIKSCPYPGCDSYIHCDIKGNKEICCGFCEYTFCFHCLKDGHRPCSCEMVSVWDSKNQSESENVKWLQVNTKQCPSCHKHIEKNQGCNHMTCRKEAGGCGYEFCWLCFAVWAGHSACNKFESEKKSQEIQDIKHELDKYIFFFTRFMNHSKSLAYAVKMKKATEKNMNSLNQNKGISHGDLIFLREGVKCIVDSRRTLKNSYIFGFYLKAGNHKALFEFHQSLLEQNADKIQGLMENDTIGTILSLDNLEEFSHAFKTFKNSVIDLYTATNKFIINLVSSIENSMMDQVDFKRNK